MDVSAQAAQGLGGQINARHVAGLLAFAALSAVASTQVDPGLTGQALLALAAGLCTAAVVVGALYLRGLARKRLHRQVISDYLVNDPSFCFIADDIGRISFANDAAQKALSSEVGQTLAHVLKDLMGNPGTLLTRMQIRAFDTGGATEEVTTRRGHLRLKATALGTKEIAWRVEETRDAPVRAGRGPSLPTVTIGRRNAVLSMNDAARHFVGDRARSLLDVFPEGVPEHGQICTARSGDKLLPCAVAETATHPGRREFVFLPINLTEAPDQSEWSAFDRLPVAVLRLEDDGMIVQSNRLARELLHLETTEGSTLQTLLEGLGRPITDWLSDAALGRYLNKSEFLRLKSAEFEVFLQVSLGRISTPEGRHVLVAVLHDATELKSLEAQFVQSQKMQAIGQLAGGVAHDFNNLLTAISGHCDLLLLRHDQDDSDFSDLVQISQNANRAAALVGQLLAFSRKQTLRPEVLDLRDTLSDLTHLLNRLVSEKVSLTLSHDPILMPVRADKRQFEQVLVNLVVNARDAMPDGGEIRIETRSQTLEKELRRDRATVPPGDYVSVRVSDQGCGIPRDKLQKVFEPFFTTKRTGEGTGLGLSTAYGIVKQSGGFIFIDSVVGQGTVFTILLPAYRESQIKKVKPPAEKSQKPPIDREEGVVLLVEDEAPVRAFASQALKLRGYTVIEAGTGEEAIELLDDQGLHVDLFVSDVIMPGMDGPTWVRQARQARPDTRVVFVSGYAEDALDDSAEPVSNSVFLPKPFSLNDLLETVQEQMS
jgi:two-component system cell cycle sensor histidine kinase/response regulator CckA